MESTCVPGPRCARLPRRPSKLPGSNRGSLDASPANYDDCKNYRVLNTRLCLFYHTVPLALSTTCTHSEREIPDQGTHLAPTIRTTVYVHYYMHKMFHVEHCTYN